MPLWLPDNSTPSWKQGFAQSKDESANSHLWKGLAGLWLPALGPTGDTLRDVGGGSNHGILTDMAPGTDWTVGPLGYRLDFDGTTESVTAPEHNHGLNDTDECTVIVWGSINGNGQALFDKTVAGSTATNLGILLFTEAGFLNWRVIAGGRGGSSSVYVAASYPMTGMFAATYSSTNGQYLYFNGDLVSSEPTWTGAFTGTVTGPTRLGRLWSNVYPLNGWISYASLYTRALPASEIASQYEEMLAPVRRRPLYVPVSVDVASLLTVTEETFQNYEPYDNDESIGTVQVTGGSAPYTWEIISQDLQ